VPVARLAVDPAFVVGALDRRLFGSFVEHMGRCVYTGIYEADHACADENGFRTDVLELVRALGVTAVRYPGPLIEDTYTVDDAVVVGSLLITLLRHADRVKIACLAQLVNVIGPIRTEPGGRAWRQTIFHPFALTAQYAGSRVLRTEIAGPEVDTAAYGRIPALWSTATYDDDRAAVNAADEPDQVVPKPVDGTGISNGICTAALPPASWHLIRLAPGGKR
jgi:alpha-L-arabinofuranosidase